MIDKDSTLGTILVAAAVCFVCSLGVVAAADALKEKQLFNAKVDKQRNLLKVVGLADGSTSANDINKIYAEKLTPVVVELATGKDVTNSAGIDAEKYNQYREAKDNGIELGKNEDVAGIKFVSKYAIAYKVQDGKGGTSAYIIPINGKALWGEVRGFLALKNDRNTVIGINFYEQKETPGLGARIASDTTWLNQWEGLKAFDPENGKPKLGVAKGPGQKPHTVEGLTGATLTSRGVDNTVKFWLGPKGFGPYLKSNN